MGIIYWIRSDLRCADNVSLRKATERNSPLACLVASTPSKQRANHFRSQFLLESLQGLASELAPHNQVLQRTELNFIDFLKQLNPATKDQIQEIVFSKEASWEEVLEENLVKDFCRSNNIKVSEHWQQTLVHLDDLPFALNEMPFVFTNFRKQVEDQWLVRPEEKAPGQLPPAWFLPNTSAVEPHGQTASRFAGGVKRAMEQLQHFVWESRAIATYKETRNGLLAWNDSSKLSPWLSLGCLSPRQVFFTVERFEHAVLANESTRWVIFELLWRDYFKFLSLKYGPRIFQLQGIVANPKPMDVEENPELFAKWKNGETGQSFIDANMREIKATGWMSNRGRQNVASYLIHNLKLPWTWGAKYFEQQLLDYDPDLNWGNWLYLSGRGTDPRARQFNPERQAQMYDPSNEYQRKWLK